MRRCQRSAVLLVVSLAGLSGLCGSEPHDEIAQVPAATVPEDFAAAVDLDPGVDLDAGDAVSDPAVPAGAEGKGGVKKAGLVSRFQQWLSTPSDKLKEAQDSGAGEVTTAAGSSGRTAAGVEGASSPGAGAGAEAGAGWGGTLLLEPQLAGGTGAAGVAADPAVPAEVAAPGAAPGTFTELHPPSLTEAAGVAGARGLAEAEAVGGKEAGKALPKEAPPKKKGKGKGPPPKKKPAPAAKAASSARPHPHDHTHTTIVDHHTHGHHARASAGGAEGAADAATPAPVPEPTPAPTPATPARVRGPVAPVVIIGNGKSVLKSKKGAEIDQYEHVVRFNLYRTKGMERHCGGKTTICILGDRKDPNQLEYKGRDCKKIYVPIPLFKGRMPYGKLCKDVTNMYRKKGFGDRMELVPDTVEKRIRKQMASKGKEQPSTGVQGIVYMVEKFKKVAILGFDFAKGDHTHYFEKKKKKGTSHNMKAETKVVNAMIKAGQVIRL